ncbi:hypothetical protein SELMODRAFT_426518 [Selaginella moellendorffii]|uniref:Uncharacterized protein n=1 Tax=Selaginella moellendorffii TaxID=88036 RepID=D8SWL8_SELML|nr:hypothetical protein SELMODRAFT_426518 [Selaginella moellendorffii]
MVVEFLRSSGDLEPDPTMTFGSSAENSPFSDEFRMVSTGFTLSDIESLLWQYEKDTFISVDREAIAASMLELTSGHKGLVGACCELLHREFIDKTTKTLEMWLQLHKDKFIFKIFVKATYYAIISACKALEPRGKELLLLLLRAGCNVKVPHDETVELLLSEGVVVDTNLDGVLCDLKFSSLLLMSTLLYGLYVRLSHSVEAGPRPPRFDHVSVISRTIERLDRSILERAESQNWDSEYSIQFEMFVKLKAVRIPIRTGL